MADAPVLPQQPTADAPMEQPAAAPSVNVFNPEGELVSVPQTHLNDALGSGYRVAAPEEVESAQKEEQYGGLGQQAITGVEGFAQGVAGPLATGAETYLMGVNPKDIRAREEVNPAIHAGTEAAGFAAGALSGVGEGALLGEAGRAAEAASGLGKGGFLSQVGAEAVNGAFQTALMQGGEEISDVFKQNPNQSAEHAVAEIGLAGVMGGVFGGAVGALLRKPAVQAAEELAPKFISELDRGAVDAGDFKASVQHSNILKPNEKEGILAGLSKEKADAGDIRKAAKELNAPVLEGMISDSHLVQKAEDSLINGAPTYSGLKRQALYQQGYDAAELAAQEALGEANRTMTKAEIGNAMKESISAQLKEQSAPIEELYSTIKAGQETIPLIESHVEGLAEELKNIKEFQISPSSPEGQLVKRVAAELPGLKTVDDIKSYKSILNRSLSPTASSGEKRMASIIGDKLGALEETTVENAAKAIAKAGAEVGAMPEAAAQAARIHDLIGLRKEANAQYKEFITKVKTLSEQLGKGKVYGVKDALHFINERLTPEEVASRLFSKKDSEFLKFFGKEFPQESQMMREYQKGVLKEAASRTGAFSPKVLFNNINKLEPEIQKAIFSAVELKKLKASETYLRAFPKNFNPSGTAHMSAMREFFHSPTGAALANLRDLATEKFIKAVSASPQVNQAVQLAKATVKGEKAAASGVKAIFNRTKEGAPAAVISLAAHRAKLDKMVGEYNQDPNKMLGMGDSTPVPAYASAFAATSARAVQYLNSIKPNTSPQAPLDIKVKPNPFQQAAYNRALDIAQQPLSVLAHIKNNTLTPQDLVTLKSIYPNVYSSLSQKLTAEMTNAMAKGQSIAYGTRMQLSMFLGEPLDSTLTPAGIMGAQPNAEAQNPSSASQRAPAASSVKGMNTLSKQAMTSSQNREADRAKH